MATLRVHVVPNAKNNRLAGTRGDAVRIKLRTPAIEGRANAALISFLAEQLKIPARKIALVRGHKSRDKMICIHELDEGELWRRLTL